MTRVSPGWKRPYLTGFGARLQALREARGYSREELARRAGTTRGHIRKLEAGWHPPRTTTLAKLAAALDVTPAELTDEQGPR